MAYNSPDLADIPLGSLRGDEQQAPPSQRRAERPPTINIPGIDSQPPVHFAHTHNAANDHFYEGQEPGDDGRVTTRSHARDDKSQYDTLVGQQRPDEVNEKLDRPHPPFAEDSQHRGHSRDLSAASSFDDETDDFDWDTDTDGVDEDGPREAIHAKRGRRVYLSCLKLARPVRLLLIGLFGAAIALTPFIVMLAAFKYHPARPQIEVWSIWLAIIWAAGVGTFLVLDWLPAVILRTSITVYGKAPELLKTYIELLMATLFFLKLVLCISWAWISLGGVLAIEYHSQAARPSYFARIFNVIQALFGTSIILLVEKIALQFVAIHFHRTAMKDRLTENQRALRALDKLHESKYKAERHRGGRQTPEWGRAFGFGGSRPTSPGPNAMGTVPKHANKASRDGLGSYFTPADDSAVNEKSAEPSAPSTAAPHSASHTHMHHHASILRRHHQHELDENGQPIQSQHSAHKAARKANFAAQLSDALAMATMKESRLYKGRAMGSQQSARRLAKKLFTNLNVEHPSRKTLIADDFIPYFPNEAEAREAFGFFDADKNGDLEKREMREAVQRIYRERRALSTSLKDMNSALSKLDMVLLSLGLIITIFIWLLIFNRNSTVANIVPLSTFVVGFSFVFGNSAKNIFESMIFIFATHPYDVGDLVCIDDVWMFVTEFGLISTTFRTVVGQTVVAPNALLASSKYIHNARRSGSQWETTTVMVNFDTAIQTIDEFRKRLRAFVKENDREWGGGLDVNYDAIEQMNCISLVIAMEHKGNWQDWGGRWARRTKLMREVKTIAEDLGMEYQLPPQPVTFSPRSGPAPFGSSSRIHFNGGRGPGAGPNSAITPVAAAGAGARRGLTIRTAT